MLKDSSTFMKRMGRTLELKPLMSDAALAQLLRTICMEYLSSLVEGHGLLWTYSDRNGMTETGEKQPLNSHIQLQQVSDMFLCFAQPGSCRMSELSIGLPP